ncbi:leucyl aminopeptidase, partial [Methylobacterium trifolii]
GFTAGKVSGRQARIVLDWPGGQVSAADAADFALGARLRAYSFDRYKTKKKPDAEEKSGTDLTLMLQAHAEAHASAQASAAVAEGVTLARDLINEPPNVLFPEEFARRASDLAKLGVEIEVIEPARMRELGMGALLAVAQGSAREPRVVLMRWNGGAPGEAPVAFIGKGVVFDSGGVSIKSAGGMEDMKGDMGGAAAVVGTMHALAARKAKVNAVGAIGIVENMPDGASYRPSDIVTSMSGQTIEVINTDAEGRLVLADVIWHVQGACKPRLMIDLATLTGAIIVALGQDIAGLFSNDDDLAAKLHEAGEAVGEKVWRMPLIPAYDKAIDSKFADMKNTGGRHGGAATAASFIKRYVNDVPWAHLDIAGVGMSSSANEINRSWGAGWGVRLLDRFVRDNYEGR